MLSAIAILLLSQGTKENTVAYRAASGFHGDLVNARLVQRDDPYWQRAESEVQASQAELRRGYKNLGKDLQRYVIARGNPKRMQVSLTFDDGPHPTFTPRLLKVLRDNKVKATFFVVGFMAERYPDLIRQIAADGHEIANHTFSHVNLSRMPLSVVQTEYRASKELLESITGKKVRYCRPPGGQFDPEVILGGASEGLTTVLWNDDPGDYANPGESILWNRTLAELKRGAIILLHDGSGQMLDILPKGIATLRQEGYKFVTLDELAKK